MIGYDTGFPEWFNVLYFVDLVIGERHHCIYWFSLFFFLFSLHLTFLFIYTHQDHYNSIRFGSGWGFPEPDDVFAGQLSWKTCTRKLAHAHIHCPTRRCQRASLWAPYFPSPNSSFDTMPGLLRKLVIVAAVDGLILHGQGVNGPRPSNGSNNEASSIRIDYKTNKITPLPVSTTEALEGRDAIEVYGLVGMSTSTVLNNRLPRTQTLTASWI